MRLPTPLCFFVLLVGCAFCLPALFADDAKPHKDAKGDSKLFDGSWKVVALEADGKKAPPEALKGMLWSFKGSELQIAAPGEKSGGKSSVKLDSSQTPKHIDLVVSVPSSLLDSATEISIVLGATLPPFQASNENVTFALPLPASCGTRTGPWKMLPQQKSSSSYRRFTGSSPGLLGGNSTSTIG